MSLIKEKLWMLLTGLLNRKHIQLSNSQASRRRRRELRDDLNPKRWWTKPVAFCRIFIEIFMKAILIPASWILVCFLRGDYYVCAFFPDPAKNETLPMPCEMHKVSFF